jgi:hypothetical protein
MSLKRDYILRIVEQLAQAIARILALRATGDVPGAIREVEGAAGGIAGMDLRMAGSVDTATLARHVPEPVRMAALARLMYERAGLAGEEGDEAGARRWRVRAVELWRAAEAAGAELDEVARAALERGAGDPS